MLGKVILLGEIFHLGDRFHGKPPIVPTLYRTVSFSVLVLVFAVADTLSKALFTGRILPRLLETSRPSMEETSLAIWEISNLFGEGTL